MEDARTAEGLTVSSDIPLFFSSFFLAALAVKFPGDRKRCIVIHKGAREDRDDTTEDKEDKEGPLLLQEIELSFFSCLT